MAEKIVADTANRQQREEFKKSRALHDSYKGAILYRFTQDGKLHVSGAPHHDIAFKCCPSQIFDGQFYPGMKMLVKYTNGKMYTAEYLGQFPSVAAAEARQRVLEAEDRKAEKRSAAEEKKSKPERVPVVKKSKNVPELQNDTPKFSTFQDRLRLGGIIPAGDIQKHSVGARSSPIVNAVKPKESISRANPKPGIAESVGSVPGSSNGNVNGAPVPAPFYAFQRTVDYGRNFITSSSEDAHNMSPLKPACVEEVDIPVGDDEGATYTSLRAPFAKDTEQHTFVASAEDYCFNSMSVEETVGGWMSQNSLVFNLAAEISADESEQMPEHVGNLLVEARTKSLSASVNDIYTPSDSVLFEREALLATPLILDNQPAEHLTTILFPTKVFGPSGPPMRSKELAVVDSSDVREKPFVAQFPNVLDGVPGVIMDTKGPFTYVKKYVLPKQYTSDVKLCQESPPLFKAHLDWRTTDMPTREEYIIPTKRTQEKEFALKNPARVNRNATGMRDTVSPWYFSLPGADKILLDEDHPNVFVDEDVTELFRKFVNREISCDKFTWFLMCRMLGGNPGLLRLWTLYVMRLQKKDCKRLYNFYEDVLGKAYFRAVECAVKRKIRDMIPPGAPASAAIISSLPKVQQNFPSFFSRRMNGWMRDCQKRDEASKSADPKEKPSNRNIGSDSEDE